MINLDNSKTYFDGTNIYFEIDRENDVLLAEPNIKNFFKQFHNTRLKSLINLFINYIFKF